MGWRRCGGSRGLTRDFAGVFGGSDSENSCDGWEEGNSVVPAAPALRPFDCAQGRAEAPSARLFFGPREITPASKLAGD